MSTPSNLTQSATAMLYSLINADNPILVNGPLSPSNVTLSAPTTVAGTHNTSITATGIAGQGYSGAVTLTYNRLDIQNDVLAILAPGGASVTNASNAMSQVAHVVAAVNSTYGLNLEEADIANWSSALTLTNDAGSATVQIAPTAIAYTGSLNVAITKQQIQPQITAPAAIPAASTFALTAGHPRLILDTSTLARMRSYQTNNTAEWQALSTYCQTYLAGVVDYPDGNQYPNTPDLGSGYQGESYVPALLNYALAYQILKIADPTTAASYGQKAVAILMAASVTPPATHSQAPSTDDGYGIRNYGLCYGYGYDWLYELLTPTQRQQVYTTANAWIDYWEGGATFEYNHPLSNYFAGYFHAKAIMTLATYDENPKAPAYWTDWYNNQFSTRIQPYYVANMAGGGWPEGFGNYGSLATMNMSMPIWAVKTGAGIDLAPCFPYPLDTCEYLMHFAWPNLTYFDDRDTSHANGNALDPPNTLDPELYALVGASLERWNDGRADVFWTYQEAICSALGTGVTTPWKQLLFKRAGTTTVQRSTQLLSFMAPGLNAGAMRSDWSTDAALVTYRGGPYVDNPDQGEQVRSAGSLAIVNAHLPLLVNTEGWIIHEPNGTSDEDLLYNDSFGNWSAAPGQYVSNAECFNVFYVRDATNNIPNQQFGQLPTTRAEGAAATTVLEEGGIYGYLKSTHLEEMYRTFTAGAPITTWTREVLFIRPDKAVVHDTTVTANAAYDQYLAWHFPAQPTWTGNVASVTYNGTYVGSMTSVLPANAVETTLGLYPSSNPQKVFQVQMRPAAAGTSQAWIHVFDLASTASESSSLPSTTADAVFIQDKVDTNHYAAVFSHAATGCAYWQPTAAATHLVAGLTAGSAYDVTVASGTVTVAAGTTYTASAQGIITFQAAAGVHPLTLTGTLAAGVKNEAYSSTLTLGGAWTNPVTLAVTGGALPAGLSYAVNGSTVTVNGTPSGSGSFTFTLTATDSSATPQTASNIQTVTIAASATITIVGTVPTTGNIASPYSVTLTASGGAMPYVFALASGALPPGVTLTAGGVLSGTPTTLGAYTFTISATDAGNYVGTQTYTVTIAAALPITYATFDPTKTIYGTNLSNGDLTATVIDHGTHTEIAAAMMVPAATAAFYWEAHVDVLDTTQAANGKSVGIGISGFGSGSGPGQDYVSPADSIGWSPDGSTWIGQTNNAASGAPTWKQGDTLMFLLHNGDYYVGVNGLWMGNPTAGTGALITGLTQTLGPALGQNTAVTATSQWTYNFGATAFTYPIPTGAKGWGLA